MLYARNQKYLFTFSVNSLRVNSKTNLSLKSRKKNYQTKKMAKADPGGSASTTRHPDPNGKKIEYEERRNRLQKVLEKRRAKSTNHPTDTHNTENGKKHTKNSK